MLTNQLAQTYAQAIYEIAADKGMLDEVQAQLEAVQATVSGHAELNALLNHPLVPPQAKKETVTKIFTGELADFVSNFLLLLIDKRRETLLTAIIGEYINIANQTRNIEVAEVTTAKPLTDSQRDALAAKLSKVTGSKIILKLHIDEQILGGVVVKIGERLIDGSIVRQLKSLKTALLSSDQIAV
ncbi:F0F1 ATP synthase subunit delta [bacterium BFN5]|nr:F0F1 ATP synthase subunit delta [bacterium BFN5]QJW44892.1 F0F1 ATP synthase subunit delta [bacterium BFN5]